MAAIEIWRLMGRTWHLPSVLIACALADYSGDRGLLIERLCTLHDAATGAAS